MAELTPAPTVYPGATLFPGTLPDPAAATTRWAARVAAGEHSVGGPQAFRQRSEYPAWAGGTLKAMAGIDLFQELAVTGGYVTVSNPLAVTWLDHSPYMERL